MTPHKIPCWRREREGGWWVMCMSFGWDREKGSLPANWCAYAASSCSCCLKSGHKDIDHTWWYAYININYLICFFLLANLVAKPLYDLAILLALYDLTVAFSQQLAILLALLKFRCMFIFTIVSVDKYYPWPHPQSIKLYWAFFYLAFFFRWQVSSSSISRAPPLLTPSAPAPVTCYFIFLYGKSHLVLYTYAHRCHKQTKKTLRERTDVAFTPITNKTAFPNSSFEIDWQRTNKKNMRLYQEINWPGCMSTE